jgi:hypothetical protein
LIGSILQHEDLQRLCRPSGGPAPTLSTLERWARKIGLRYTYDGKGGLITTVDALNAALGIAQASNDSGKYNADEVL